MDKFDRVFDGQDMAIFGLILVVNHCCQRGRFTGAGRTGNQHHTTRKVRDILEDLGCVQLFKC